MKGIKIWTLLLAAVVAAMLLVGCGSAKTTPTVKPEKKTKVVLITVDSINQYWLYVQKGARDEAAKLGGIDYKQMAPDRVDDAQQIERINNAVADGADVIIIASNSPTA